MYERNPILGDPCQGWVSMVCYEENCDCNLIHFQPERLNDPTSEEEDAIV
jgi:hypothetical protein